MKRDSKERIEAVISVARTIQAVTREPFPLAMEQAKTLESQCWEGLVCAVTSGEYICSLRFGPHPGWLHFDESRETWWQQSRVYPYRAPVAVDELRMEHEAKTTANLHALEDQVAEARMWARHGYEIGQRSCTWSDHGVAPAWLTDGWDVNAFARPIEPSGGV